MTERIHPNVKVHHLSPNRYIGRPSHPRLIVIHDTESHNRPGISDLASIGALFGDADFKASAHVCTDGDGNSARFVPDEDAAWACVAYNRSSLNAEQIGFATGGEYTRAEVHETARWVAHWSHVHGIPIRWARTLAGVVIRSGVTTHEKLGRAGGGHSDPGRFPMDKMLKLAREYKHKINAAT